MPTYEIMLALRLFWLQGEIQDPFNIKHPKSMKDIYKEAH